MARSKYRKLNGPTVAFDIDDTILMWDVPKNYKGELITVNYGGFQEKAIPNTYNIEHLKKMKRRGHGVLAWSRGGEHWCEAVIKALKLEEYVDVVMAKLSYHVDDIRDPKDKLGRWSYISTDGIVEKENFDGTITKHKKHE